MTIFDSIKYSLLDDGTSVGGWAWDELPIRIRGKVITYPDFYELTTEERVKVFRKIILEHEE